ncbi:hypothetical protein [Aquimarina brevivitae]|uniref:Uncharacterized protein n=1 Tax=Aquimarina brevivitae TaxID=323412 RepID=A0A4Q7P243_9FLAO|nr:hypothetical protein [Aquimarina brevivitae]RZS93953.1 hypothetical protein EV197_2534 [Aquimarina brevivitae]
MKFTKVLAKTNRYALYTAYEDVFFYDELHKIEIWRRTMFGEAACGFISASTDWAIVGGEYLLLWKNNQLKEFNKPELCWCHCIRQTDTNEVELLIDPWSKHAAIWKFNSAAETFEKLRDFKKYLNKPYTDTVVW